MTAQEAERKQKRTKFILGTILLVIMVLSTAGYAILYNSDPSSQQGSGIRFNGVQWIVPVNGVDLLFTNSPDSVADVPVDVTVTLSAYTSTPVYVASNSTSVNNELGNLRYFVPRMQRACYGDCEEDLPVKDCSSNLIVWKDSSENKVYQEQNCVFIEGDLRAVDAFLFDLFEV